MGYDEGLAERIRSALAALDRPAAEKKMFGGVAFMLDEKMCVGVVNDDLMVRVGPSGHEAALKERGARVMDFTHRPAIGFVFVSPTGHESDEDLTKWLRWSIEYVDTVPVKPAKADKKAAARLTGKSKPR